MTSNINQPFGQFVFKKIEILFLVLIKEENELRQDFLTKELQKELLFRLYFFLDDYLFFVYRTQFLLISRK
jgi:hypothetical protein